MNRISYHLFTIQYKGAAVDEHQWIHSIRKGNKKYLQDIAVKYYDDIYRFCAFQTGNREDAYDLAQETFLRFIRYIEGYHDRNLKGYLLTIAMNVCRSYLSKKAADRTVPVPFDENWQQTPGVWQQSSVFRQQADEFQQQALDIQPQALKSCQQVSDTRQQALEPQQASDIPSQSLKSCQQAPDIKQQSSGDRQLPPEFLQQTSESPEERAIRQDIHDRLMHALSKLPEMQREAILLHYLQNMKYREIAKQTETTVSTVKSRVRQGVEKLHEFLREEDFLIE